jgi:methionine synthase / methylenetetrahydrofolate reductase(NADPH)
MAATLDEPRQPVLDLIPSSDTDEVAERTTAPTHMSTLLRQGRFVVCVEMEPPKGHSAARLVAGAETLLEAGADVIYVSDSSRARLRMSAWAACRLVQEHVGIETILGFPTRGRNLLRVQGDLLASHALGLRHLFVCMGDPTQIGDYPSATDTQDIAPTGLIKLVSGSLNSGADQAGTSIGEPTDFVVGCALNLNTTDPDRETRLLKRKIDSGADFALCQPIFGMDVLRTFRKAYEERYGQLTLPLIVGAWPLLNSRNAEYLHNEIPGITIPDEIRQRMREAGDDSEAEGVRIAIDVASQLRTEAAGVYICPPFRRYDLAAEVVEAVRG